VEPWSTLFNFSERPKVLKLILETARDEQRKKLFILLNWTLSAHFSFQMGWTLSSHFSFEMGWTLQAHFSFEMGWRPFYFTGAFFI
jgi:hypothetical protein